MTNEEISHLTGVRRLAERGLFSAWRGVMSVTALSALTGFLASTIAARALGAENYGIYAVAINAMTVAVATATIGYPMAILRFGPPLLSQNNVASFDALVHSALTRALALASTIAIVGILALYFFPQIAPRGRLDVMVVMILASPIAIWVQIFTATNRCFGHLELALLPDAIMKNFVIVCWGCFVLLQPWTIKRDPLSFAFAYMVGLGVSAILVYLVHMRSIGSHPKSKPRGAVNPDWFVSAAGFFSHYLIGVARSNADIFVVAAVTSTSQAGIYAISLKLGEILSAIAGTLNYVLSPRISMAFAKGDIAGLQNEQRSAAWVLAGFAIAVGAPLIIWAHTWLNLFGTDFGQGVWVLRLAVIAGMMPCFSGPTYQVLCMSGNEWLVTRIETAGLIVQFIALATLVSPFGALGAAAARCIGLLATGIMGWWNIRNRLEISLGIASLIRLPPTPP